jgi:ABC-2 type transport system permease protein
LTFGFLAFLIGASFVSAEISTGALGTWLTFVPRRVQVMSSKLAAIALFLVPTMAALVATLVAGVYAVSRWRGTVGVVTTADGTALGWLGVRVLVASVVAGVVGACLGALTRHTAAAIATAFVYVVSFEALLRGWQPELARWLVAPNVDAWVQGGSTFYVETCSTQRDGSYACTGIERFVSQADGARFGLVVLAVLAVATVLVFRRRDVT